MGNILISGLVNTETTAKVRKFPIDYYPIDYPFFGIDTAVSGVGYNLALAMKTLGDDVRLCSMTGGDFPAAYIRGELKKAGIRDDFMKEKLAQTPSSVVLYDDTGRRQIYCDLKDIQETRYGFDRDVLQGANLVVACNINFNRELLHLAKDSNKKIATDVHVLYDIHDDYNWEFMECADILFLSDEGVGHNYRSFMADLARTYHNEIIVMGRGSQGAAMYIRYGQRFLDMPAVSVGPVVNTVGAGDALFSAFNHFYAKGCGPEEALRYAQVFASAKIGTSGASRGFIREEEVKNLSRSAYNR